MRSKSVLVGAMTVAALAAPPVLASPVDAVRAGDMQQMIAEIVDVYENAGLSWDHGIEWHTGPFTTTFWFYDPNEDEIEAGAVPTDAEVDEYWRTWSKVLTDGNFAPESFFASAVEARELAHYNQYVLATHESAHAITFRYDYAHLRRHDYAINCREYYADRLTVAILNEQARLEPDMARWRERYRELVTAMGETIPEQYRYHIADFATLDANCALIDVAQPTPDTMQPYASAYFERYRVLLEADLPPMAEVFETHLGRYHEAELARLPLDADRARYQLVTRDTRLERAYVNGERPDDGMRRTSAAAFGPDGTLYFATLAHDSDTQQVELEFGNNSGINPELGPPSTWPRPSNRLEISSLAVLSPDSFLAALEHWQYVEGSEDQELHLVSWLAATRVDGVWTVETLSEVDDMARAVVLRSPSDRIFLLATPDSAATASSSENWRGLEIDPGTGEVVRELPMPSTFERPYAIDGEDRVYEASLDLLWRSTTEGTDTVFAGVGLQGLRDGPLDSAELVYPEAMQWLADGTALILDAVPGYASFAIREVRPLQ